MPRITLRLEIDERDALFRLAHRECRNPRAQALLFIRSGLEIMGYLSEGQNKHVSNHLESQGVDDETDKD